MGMMLTFIVLMSIYLMTDYLLSDVEPLPVIFIFLFVSWAWPLTLLIWFGVKGVFKLEQISKTIKNKGGKEMNKEYLINKVNEEKANLKLLVSYQDQTDLVKKATNLKQQEIESLELLLKQMEEKEERLKVKRVIDESGVF